MTSTSEYVYLIALGSNQRHPNMGGPRRIIAHAFDALETADISLFDCSSIISSAPVGPSQRQYANAAAIIISPLSPPELLLQLKSLEAHFGRRQYGQKWRARILDIDIILWSGGVWSGANPALHIPHHHMQSRCFVLQPAAQIAGNWRDPIGGLQIKHLFHRIKRPKRVDPRSAAN
ncbi:2-amino-4-hydroxy-6-hydroxymethyldihydropteridine diphosphokinase [Sphingorhabdus arenilitoris]|uniref:2-amino-4-hydroxy-6-hydroxymethyldihydropteridine pyrophosphokinase n=1 Tax=Sphingorhabdus arenilitoris TaxID=1490041 RepID=A0ABV8RJP9_9SPHN